MASGVSYIGTLFFLAFSIVYDIPCFPICRIVQDGTQLLGLSLDAVLYSIRIGHLMLPCPTKKQPFQMEGGGTLPYSYCTLLYYSTLLYDSVNFCFWYGMTHLSYGMTWFLSSS